MVMINTEPLNRLNGLYADTVKEYIDDMVKGKRPHCKEDFQRVQRFIEMLDTYEVNTAEADKILMIGEEVCKFVDGSDIEGYNLSDKPFRWLDWQIFDIYATFIFYKPGTKQRVTKASFTEVARKQGKSTLIAILALSLALKDMRNGGAPIGIVADTKDNAENLMKIIEKNILGWYNNSKRAAQRDGWKILNNNQKIKISHDNFAPDENGENGGKIDIQVYAAKNEGVHALRKKIVIIDELHLMKHGAAVHKNMEKSTANYPADGLTLTITTAAIDKNNYCYDYTEYCKKVLNKQIKRDSLYIHIAKADEDDEGKVDLLDENQWYKANPSLGQTLSIETLRKDAEEALNVSDETKMQFMAYSLNIFQNKVSTEFQPSKFIFSDMEYNWSLEELSKLDITWYGGFDLSLYNDLQAAALYGQYGDVGIVIPHAWCPTSEITTKVSLQNMDAYRWRDDGFFSFCNGETNDPMLVVEWFKEMRDRGFNISEIGFDTRYVTTEVKGELVRADFDIIKEKQYTSHLSLGFRHLEDRAFNKKLYYLHSELYEYCLNNLLVTTKKGQEVYYEKVDKNSKIDAFDASVMAATRFLCNIEKRKQEQELASYLDLVIARQGGD